MFGGDAVDAMLAGELDGLTRMVLGALVGGLDVYATLPLDELDGDITDAIRRALQICGRLLSTGQLPTDNDLESTVESAARRAEEGVPLDLMLSAYVLGARQVWELLTQRAEPQDLDSMRIAGSRLLQYLEVALAAAANGYLDEQLAISGSREADDLRVLTALVDGPRTDGAAAVVLDDLPDDYLVARVAIGASRAESVPGVDATIARRRRLRSVRLEFESMADRHLYTSLESDGGLVLVPSDASGSRWGDLAEVIERVGQIAEAPVTAAATVARRPDIPASAALAQRLLRLARSAGRPPGLYGLDELALELQLDESGPAREHLVARLAPLHGRSELTETLRVYFDSDKNRQVSARLLHVHVNTLDYRLRSIERLTGLDPTRFRDSMMLAAALSASG